MVESYGSRVESQKNAASTFWPLTLDSEPLTTFVIQAFSSMSFLSTRNHRPANDLQAQIATTAFAFRGYNVTNLGRTPELLAHKTYGPILRRYLHEAGDLCADVIGRPVDLADRVERRSEPGLDDYAEAVALCFAVEFAQMQLVRNSTVCISARPKCRSATVWAN